MGAARATAENRAYTVSDILKLAHKFKDIEVELYKIRRSLGPKMSETEIRAASSFWRASLFFPIPEVDHPLFL